MDPTRLPRLALESSQAIATRGTHPSWYGSTVTWFTAHGLQIDHLPPYQYDPASPYIRLSRVDRNRVLRYDLLQAHIRDTWIPSTGTLPVKMQYYRDHFLRLTEDGFIQRPGYMDVFMSHAMRIAIGQLRVSSHTLEIEAGRAVRVAREDRICRLCSREVESEEHYVCRCPVYYEIRGRYHCLFREGFGPISRITDFPDQRCLGLFLMELRRHRESLLRAPTPRAGLAQPMITSFFRPQHEEPTPPAHPTLHQVRTVSRSTGVTLPRATALRATRGPRPPTSRPPPIHQGQIDVTLTRHQRAMEALSSQPLFDLSDLAASLSNPMMDLIHGPLPPIDPG